MAKAMREFRPLFFMRKRLASATVPKDVMKNKNDEIILGTLAGVLAGVAGTVAMDVMNSGRRKSDSDSEPERFAHYAMGAVMGGVYGALSARFSNFSKGAGLPFGWVVWESVLLLGKPLLGLTKWPFEGHKALGGSGLASHAAYALVTDRVKRQLTGN